MKKILILPLIIISVIILTGCNKKIESTDLTNIYLDDMTIDMKIDLKKLSNYTTTDRYSGNYKYKFEEIIIDTNKDNKINYLFAKLDNNTVDIKINNNKIKTIDEVSNILGNNYQDKTYDREQQLKEYIYIDKENKIKAEFVYLTWDKHVVWIILSK